MMTTAQKELQRLYARKLTDSAICRRTNLKRSYIKDIKKGIEPPEWVFEKLFALEEFLRLNLNNLNQKHK